MPDVSIRSEVREPEPPVPAPLLDLEIRESDLTIIAVLLEGFAATQAAICLSDEADNIRYLNPAFRTAFFPNLRATGGVNFVDALADSIREGVGLKLVSMTLEEFVQRVRRRRMSGVAAFNFALDMMDGSWWWVSDYRLPRGWTLVIANEMSALKREEARLRDAHASAVQAAHTDFLTGIANRRRGFEQAEATLAAASASGSSVAVGLIDIDHFKQINDRWGHEGGDQVLIRFAHGLIDGMRRQDQVSRIGGEEFLVVLPDLRLSSAEDLLTRVLGRLPPCAFGAERLPVTASVGLAAVRPFETFDNVLRRADHALYLAKTTGRNRIVLAGPHDPDAPPRNRPGDVN